ncbi:MAG: DUF192 domain-containing protein [Janthinobacterium lividum]
MTLILQNKRWQKILGLFFFVTIFLGQPKRLFCSSSLSSNDQHTTLSLDRSTESIAFHVDIASTPQALAQGLMNRRHLAKDAGMLFVFPKLQKTKFWMKDTYLALDLVFMDENFNVVQLHENAQPLDLTKIESDVPIKYVLEISAGSIQHYNIQKGDLFKAESPF